MTLTDPAPDEPALADNLVHRINVGDSLTRTASRRPGRCALVDGDRRWTYRELNAWVNRLAHGLLDRGYARGHALALASGNSAEFLAVYYACAKTGVVCVPVNLAWRADEVAYVLRHSGARGVVVEAQLVEGLATAIEQAPGVVDVLVAPGTGGVPPRAPADRSWATLDEVCSGDEAEPEVVVADRDPITYLYTSGTTSAPKGVVGNHAAIYLESLTMAFEARFDADDRFVAMLPMFHTAQLNTHCTPAVMAGATIFVRRAFDPADLLALVERERITQIFGLPMMYRAMLDHPDVATRDLSSLRRACYAMAPMPEEQLRRAIATFGCDFYLLFGQTEMSPTTTLFRPEHQLSHAGAVGTPVVNVQLAIMGPDGELLPDGQQGEIVYRGPHAMTGYLHDPAATARVFEHGWFHSGDLGHVDVDGLLWFTDRTKDVIKTGGENVASMEVEKAVLAADPAVGEAVVVGLPHARWSEAVTAVVVPATGTVLDTDALTRTLGGSLDRHKVPKSVIVVDELPRTSTGKVQKNVLRERFADHYGDRDAGR